MERNHCIFISIYFQFLKTSVLHELCDVKAFFHRDKILLSSSFLCGMFVGKR